MDKLSKEHILDGKRPIRGSRNLFVDFETDTLWWRRPSGMWQQLQVNLGDNGEQWAKVSISFEVLKELATT